MAGRRPQRGLDELVAAAEERDRRIRAGSGQEGPGGAGGAHGRAEAASAAEPLARLSVYMPRDLRRRFKGKTAMEGITMTDVVLEAVRHYMGE